MSFRPCVACSPGGVSTPERLATVLGVGLRIGPIPQIGVVLDRIPNFSECKICSKSIATDTSKENPFVILECSHSFHLSCIAQRMQHDMSCPTCKTPLSLHDQRDINTNPNRSITTTIDDKKLTYRGPVGDQRLDHIEHSNGMETYFYEGTSGAERLVRTKRRDGVQHFFTGDRGAERLERIEYPTGLKVLYKGDSPFEQKFQTVHPDGFNEFFDGPKDAEYKVSTISPDGTARYFKGEKDVERLVMAVLVNGTTSIYDGPSRAERRVSTKFPDGRTEFYDGEKGDEYKVYTEDRFGHRHFFLGEKGNERLEHIELANGTKMFYIGPKHEEWVERIEMPGKAPLYYEPRSSVALRDDEVAKRMRTDALFREKSEL